MRPPRRIMKKTFSPKQREALQAIADGQFYPDLVKESDGWHARWRAIAGDDNPWVDDYVREANVTPLSEDAEKQKHETLHDAWMMALKSRTGLVKWDECECEKFAAELNEWHGNANDAAERAAICFELEVEGEQFRLACEIPKNRERLRALGQAVYVFGALRNMRRGKANRLEVDLTPGEAEAFLRLGAKELREAGYTVSGDQLKAEITAEAELTSQEANGKTAAANAKATYKAELKVHVAGEVVTANEIRFLLDQGSSLVFFRNRWIEVNVNILREALRALEKSQGRKLSRMEAVSFALGVGALGGMDIRRVQTHGGLRALINSLKAAGQVDLLNFTPPANFVGTLRDYQKRGAAWLSFLTEHGFGALLADDMGLGKTSQTIAWILRDKAQLAAEKKPRDSAALFSRPAPYLVIAPLTLLSNWAHEFAKFAPSLRIHIHQGDARHMGAGFRLAIAKTDVVITSYSLLVKDYRTLSETPWRALILDEAQMIKNPATQTARAVCALRPMCRIALTGTPVENSVSDIWSIEQFLNPGLLSDRATFAARFVKPLAANPLSNLGRRLAHALEPFVLRRLKSDPSVKSELGDKREVREYCTLSMAERAAYEEALADFRMNDRHQGDIFALLTNLKLVCDGMLSSALLQKRPELLAESGKVLRLLSLLESIFESGESALIFTQYARVGAALQDILAEHFGRRMPYLHGALSASAREREINSFMKSKEPSAFILSLKAGGFGLNLTRASHVIHYDRWWNPAVENQATDRVHRIGQTHDVLVHLFIAAGTLEEHVDEILNRKAALAGTLVTTGEGFLSQMSTQEFERTVALDE